ncbi:MAG: Asp-tRNA(Asn)/Glu-tRNA(Gln) amidotransferase subunit GatB [Candidatus Riflebacteria bacterium]|nr:Asp-tRNA(Asn)/Glu-tRNA(Gln) amidotransferase subunit GatB [Candidatus Riflebacteria bacterium]
MEYELVIGIEIHAQLSTQTKLFCSCPNNFGDIPNQNTCPVCLAHPGTLPVINRTAVEKTVKAGIAFHCEINSFSRFARKNYFYPDLPKGYQISQYESPVCSNGYFEIKGSDGLPKRIRLRRIHIEEDAGKLMHETVKSGSLVDLNRAGTPLMEMVTEPDFSSADEVYDFLVRLRRILRYLNVCDGNMEEGSMRCEPNISIRPKGSTQLGTKIELKNINSFKAAKRGIEFEFRRQILCLDMGEKLCQETRGWDDNKGESFLMRTKEDAHDYRYFPDPDLQPLRIPESLIKQISETMEELPDARKDRLVKVYGLSENDVEVLCSEKTHAEYFEKTAERCNDPKLAANWVMGEVLRVLKNDSNLESFPIQPDRLGMLVSLIKQGKISGTIAKKVFELMLKNPDSPEKIVSERGLSVVGDDDSILKVVQEIIAEFPDQITQYLSGKEKVFGFLIGNAMKKMKGKADPAKLNQMMKDEIEKKKNM